MDKKIIKMAMAAVFAAFVFCGCQKEPESSANGEIRHAKSSAENKVDDIAEEAKEASEIERSGKEIHAVIGTEENSVRIEASYPYISQHVYQMVLEKNDVLNENLLQGFLESDSGSIVDLSEERRKKAQQEEAENAKNTEDKAVCSVFGDSSFLVLADENKEAGFLGGTTGYYEDGQLKKKCGLIYKSGTETACNIGKRGEEAALADTEGESVKGNSEFSVGEAEHMLLAKLSKIDLEEIMVYEATMYQSEDFMFYELKFTPSYEGMGIVHEVGSVSAGEVYLSGYAWVCSDGVAFINLPGSLGKVKQKEECEKLLSWEQIEKIINVNLENGKIHGGNEVVLSQAEILYYPLFDEGKNEVELRPVWQVYIPMSAWMENDKLTEEIGTDGTVWNICVDAVSGEIVRME